ncbi:MAG: cation diffusion facilitator family transporter [Rhodospirillales bacterium]
MVLSIVVTLGLVLFQRRVIRATGSVAIGADALHYKSDLLVNLAVIAALVASGTLGWALADPLLAGAVALYILWSAWEIFANSVNLLMDRELPEEDRERIRTIAMAHPAVISLHDLRTRSSGTQMFIQFHLELDPNLALIDAHAIAEAVMHEVEGAFANAEVLIHEDPFGVKERRATFE